MCSGHNLGDICLFWRKITFENFLWQTWELHLLILPKTCQKICVQQAQTEVIYRDSTNTDSCIPTSVGSMRQLLPRIKTCQYQFSAWTPPIYIITALPVSRVHCWPSQMITCSACLFVYMGTVIHHSRSMHSQGTKAVQWQTRQGPTVNVCLSAWSTLYFPRLDLVVCFSVEQILPSHCKNTTFHSSTSKNQSLTKNLG